ncbi:hypothetical protein E1A91_D07G129500v1 [Gossypium mustelinum]|uniref:Strictosidine synthase conserved region domain-containing protein n=2 Tax=Gossypium TaxID=3633 RepID=A0A0D2N8U6_GOSRA|nr:hypothetical protein B456_001G126900 [Gossypium raimondii]TYI73437.1 hypothetical protein E1A91_D07G129500v1 [Gossypium mustelinum]
MTPVGILGILFLLLALYCGTDPFKHSAISEFPDFEAYKVDMPPWEMVPMVRDKDNLLQKSEIKFLNQVQGPESMAFDPLGRGPYTGVADGRIVFWDGEKWNDFAHTSSNRNFKQLIFSSENGGRLIKYNPHTKETTILMTNLQFPNGVSLSKDGTFLVCCEGCPGRLLRYWLKGEKAGTWEVFAILPGFPDNIRTNKDGEFWVAINSRRSMYAHILGLHPKVRKFILKLPISTKVQVLLHVGGKLHAQVVKYSPEGKLLRILEDSEGKVVKAVSEVDERDGKLWLGSVLMPFIAVYDLN